MFFKRKKKSDVRTSAWGEAASPAGDSSGGPANNSKPVIAYTSYDPFEVAMIKSMLASADIEFHVTNEIVTGYGPTASSTQGMDVFVREEDVDDTRAIIGQLVDGT